MILRSVAVRLAVDVLWLGCTAVMFLVLDLST
jgi:hypothetical protein